MYHHKVSFNEPFKLESGSALPAIEVAYCTYGKLNETRSNVVWICHALTANADAMDWWQGMVGYGKTFDPNSYFIICANIIGSPYGTTSPLSINPENGLTYSKDFPLITIRDMVQAHELLRKHLGIDRIKILIGGSLGGQQALEWAIEFASTIEHLILLATNAKHSAWGIAFNETQRMALEAGEKGLETARAIAMLSYRNYVTYEQTQTDNNEMIDNFKASSYQRYQGIKLSNRFHPDCYYTLSKSMDSHNVGRGRGNIANALSGVKAKTLVIGIETDLLFPTQEQALLAKYIRDAKLEIIISLYGHDGFLIEVEAISAAVNNFLLSDT